MIKYILAATAFLFACLNLPAFADDFDLTGKWTIQIVDNPDDPFRGSITIEKDDSELPDSAIKKYKGTLITEDRCCDGNYSKVQQISRIGLIDGRVMVRSEIEKFLIQDEPNPGPTYSADSFDLQVQDDGTLLGTLNNWTEVRWVRANAGMV